VSVTAWEDDNSILHARRRALVAARAVKPDRLAVLLVDRPEQTTALKHALAGQTVELETANDPAVGLFLLGRTCPDVAVVGPTNARLDTRSFLEVVSAHEPELPLIVGVGVDDGDLAGHAAGLGAAVLAHPYQPDKLMRLLKSLAPTQRRIEVRPLTLDFGRLRIDGAAPQIWLDGVASKIPMREHLVLRYLAERAGTVVSRRELITAIWGGDGGSSNTLSTHILRLRRRLERNEAKPQWIQAVRGIGYEFIVPSEQGLGQLTEA
jgi:DNA-binding response OmpR family regulator